MKLNNKYFSPVYILMAIFFALSSRYSTYYLNTSISLRRIITILNYLPFIIVIIVKLGYDMKSKIVLKENLSKASIMYYILAVYFFFIECYRYFMNYEIKESIYYSIILFGSVAYILLSMEEATSVDNTKLGKNVLCVAWFFIIYRLLWYFALNKVLLYPPINDILSTSVLVMLVPVEFSLLVLSKKQSEVRQSMQIYCILCLTTIIVMITSSRSLAFLFIIVIVLGITLILNKRTRKKCVISLLIALLSLSAMYKFDIFNTQYAIFREFGIRVHASNNDNLSQKDEKQEPAGESKKQELSTESEKQKLAAEQIERSDVARKELIALGIEQIKKNVLFGTGDVVYQQYIAGEWFNQSSHNWIIETLVSYGVVGAIIMLVLVVCFIKNCNIMYKHNRRVFILLSLVFFGMGMVQPIVYDVITTPIYCMCLIYLCAIKRQFSYDEKKE